MPITPISMQTISDLLDQFRQASAAPVTKLQSLVTTAQSQQTALFSVSQKLSTLQAVAQTLNTPSNFNVNTVSVSKPPSGATLLTATADQTAAAGSTPVTVKQIAQPNEVASQGMSDQNTASIAAAGGSFVFRVGSAGAVTTVAVTAGMTLQGLRDAINAAAGGAVASIINDGTGINPYRLALTGATSGSNAAVTILTNNTTLDFTNKNVGTAYAYAANSFSGTASSNAGANYTGTANQTFLVQVVAGGAPGTATYKYSVDGGITWLGYGGVAYNASAAPATAGAPVVAAVAQAAIDGAGTANQGVQIGFGATGTLAVGDRFSIDAYNPQMQVNQDAVVQVGNVTITNSSNTITGALQGVTLNLTQADPANPVTVSTAADATALTKTIQDFVKAYNDVYGYLNATLSYSGDATPQASSATRGDSSLRGDATLRTLQLKLKSLISGSRLGALGGKQNLSQVGITSDAHTGQLSVNTGTLSAAITSDPAGVRRLFLGLGTPSNPAITALGIAPTTQPGTYGVTVTAPPKQAIVGGVGDATMQDLSATGLTNTETLSFTYTATATSAAPSVTAFSASLAAGMRINDIVNRLNSVFQTNHVTVTASNESGRLKLTSLDYGVTAKMTVVSDQAGATQTGIGSLVRTVSGVDIAGTINGHAAVGSGTILTSRSGFAETGLRLSTQVTQSGLYGAVTVSRGIGDQLASFLDSYTNAQAGILIQHANTIQASIKSTTAAITRTQSHIDQEAAQLQDQLIAVRTAMTSAANVESSLQAQFPGLQTMLSNM